MRIDIVTLFPDFFDSALKVGLLGRAFQKGIANVVFTNPRTFSENKHQRVDDEPYGGGVGMVLKPEPLFRAVESLPMLSPRQTVLLSPQGEPLQQRHLQQWAQTTSQLVLLCGHYEGFDERVRTLATQEISLGDFVLTCGEIPALSILNGVVRLLPGTVGKAESLADDSFATGLLEYPQYTRPPEFRGMEVPPVLRSGDHQAIANWRLAQQQDRTRCRRPDLWAIWQAQQQLGHQSPQNSEQP
ncbi:MAG: tRNA (guanosine(37)-N1)-methyltransferase TrmD [Cyanobacteria bacterium P01_H01_bin.15]